MLGPHPRAGVLQGIDQPPNAANLAPAALCRSCSGDDNLSPTGLLRRYARELPQPHGRHWLSRLPVLRFTNAPDPKEITVRPRPYPRDHCADVPQNADVLVVGRTETGVRDVPDAVEREFAKRTAFQ